MMSEMTTGLRGMMSVSEPESGRSEGRINSYKHSFHRDRIEKKQKA